MYEVIKSIRAKLDEVRKHGERLLDNGARLVYPAPEIAPKAWHFVLFAPLDESAIEKLEGELGTPFPEDFREFLKVWNGLKLFGYEINVWGKRKNYVRVGDEAWQPFDLVAHNRPSERPKGSPENILYIASVESTNEGIFIDLDDKNFGRVGSTTYNFYYPKQYWTNFEEWLKSEFEWRWKKFYEGAPS